MTRLTARHPRVSPSLRYSAGLLATALVAAACSTSAPDDTPDEQDTADDDSSSGPPEKSGEAQPVTVAFGGDVHFEGELRQRLDSDPTSALSPVGDAFSDADIAMVNLETAVTEGGTPAPDKQFRFRAPASAFDALDAANADLATVANNHGMDYGADGLRDTLDNAEDAGFPVVGAGESAEEAYSPHVVETNGTSVAFIGATDVLNTNLIDAWTAKEDSAGLASAKGEQRQRLVSAVSSAAEEADHVVTYLHWGAEGDHCPRQHAPGLARELVGAGADAVVGGHAHVLSPGGYIDDSYVHYGLGNFAFYNYQGPTAESGVLTLTLDQGEVTGDSWQPARIEGGVPRPYEGAAAEDARTEWRNLGAGCSAELFDPSAEQAG
ncbi:poly-gamma-glutamate synthesis protein (capsule biosynthesis protein) [Haloactinospora alba]|uniref:Poly-gamma-glutamate synthesis protein (Capsule biosynthesis protein) n=1 Tax=Haloactinospora alba TaxID=405555 RepID=A0A543NAA6_9ACTN|nr:CapA family protein [Haloactinospora alba]TQN28739.1 poly-gamma-glutamate synthesis protein (capsule biosynthesis protein) [Haloactinospora alba]